MSIRENLERLRKHISQIATEAHRDPDDISLVAVTKTVGLPLILDAIEAGIKNIGENRVQEARDKFPSIPEGITRHMVGHLQRNKVRMALDLFDLIHSLDRISLAQEISRRARAEGKTVRALVQVNTIGDEEKFGVPPGEVERFLQEVSRMDGLQVEGLMTIAPLTSDRERIRSSFQTLRELKENLEQKDIPGLTMKHLSMGMTSDYDLAIREGATLIRIGTAIFGARTG